MKSHLVALQEKTDERTALTLDAIEKYVRCMSSKLNDPLTAPKTYWSMLKNGEIPAIPPLLVNGDIITNLLNGFLYNREIPAIPRLPVNGEIITNFSEKADIFKKFFGRSVYTSL